ncbi:hypothetical protein [Shimia sp. NS0008-38b]|uniref:hypothetical protein n=1 Tax=Shimia sp. NS0008-38b TaxID=3127653 RepID=UPI00333F2CE0
MTRPVHAHTSEGGFVLLLPTDMYIASGVLAVALTVAMLIALPAAVTSNLFQPFSLSKPLFGDAVRMRFELSTSLLSAGVLLWLLYVGLNGPRDPLANPLPLSIWSIGWIGFVFLQGMLGDLWRVFNPWRGLVWITHNALGLHPLARFPSWLGQSIGLVSFGVIVGFLLADVAPSDPARLARFVGLYWLVGLVGRIIFGSRWARRADGLTMLLSLYAKVGVFARRGGKFCLGLNGWQIARRRPLPIGISVLCLLMLGSGIFDGLNETFWWLAKIGINPLEFPGRSAVIWQTLTGLVATNLALIALFCLTLWIGVRLARVDMPFAKAFCIFAPTVLPIALGYHFAHYFTSFLVEAQYALVAASDPWATGQDFLGLGTFYVSTGFFNSQDSVRVLWLCQAGGIVVGHMVALLLSHAVALRHFGNRATLSQVPLAMFMIFCTFIGLWLLASPRGF